MIAQIEYSLFSRGIEASILPTCRTLGIGITAYGVLSRGLISDRWSKNKITPGDFRSYSPRFQGENLERNLKLLEPIRMIAQSRVLRWHRSFRLMICTRLKEPCLRGLRPVPDTQKLKWRIWIASGDELLIGLLEADDTTNPSLLSYRFVSFQRGFKWPRLIQPKPW